MEKNQHKFKGQSFLGDIEDFVMHPIDTLEGRAQKAVQFAIHPIDTTKKFFNEEVKDVKNVVQNPLGSFESGLTEIKNEITEIPRALTQGFNNLETFTNTVESGIETARDDIQIAGKWIWNESQIIGEKMWPVLEKVFLTSVVTLLILLKTIIN